jgi:translation initiation factor IF-3
MTIAEHDLARKLVQATKALDKGEQVRVQLQLKGREKSRPQSAVEWLNGHVLTPLSGISTLNKPPTPQNLNVVLFPKKK